MSSVPILPYNERKVICLLCSAMPAVLLSSGLSKVLVAQVHLPLLFVTSCIEVAVSSLCALWGHHPAHPQFFLKRHFPAVGEGGGWEHSVNSDQGDPLYQGSLPLWH